MNNKIKLIELMTSKMFHDLAGPVGATFNSVEFLDEENNNIREKALSIIKSSTQESIIRLKFFRQVYGTFNDEEVYLNNYTQLAEEFLANTKLKIEWQLSDTPISGMLTKGILNFLIIAIGVLIHGGLITVKQIEKNFIISFKAENFTFSEDTKLLLEGDISFVPLTSSNIQIYYTHLMLEEAKAKLNIKTSSDGVDFEISMKD